MRRLSQTLLPLLMAPALLAAPALAQAPTATPATPPEAAASPDHRPRHTVLALSETAEVRRAPDEVHAELRAEARAGTAAGAQAALNAAMQKALATAKAVTGVTATTGAYWTSRNEESRQWVATQSLRLRGAEAAPLLELAGSLQEQRLALGELGWSLSRPQEQAARQEAERMAIAALRARAEAVAGQLGMKVAAIRRLQLGEAERPQPRMMAMAAARRDGAPAPVSAPEDVIVQATASAEILLSP
ncbi:SIMPL domain-containing protein [Roseomonas sp. 18066]|uniref:SIMPL domain-containing protein n=1 Tax=Roseomonas sp. 18066 TaxID=2681412 RepID=UPI0013587FB5|nr:SIMPL domain-containing protein [Roseomonas sp. 18066]